MVISKGSKEREKDMKSYDPRWHSAVAAFARNLADPANEREIRKRAQRLEDHWETRRFAPALFDQRLRAFRADEFAGETRLRFDPLRIDEDLVEIAAMLPYVHPQTLAWLSPIRDEIVAIAERTRPLRQRILSAAERAPVLDLAC